MCGITGFIGLELDNPKATLQKMMCALSHRGPDDSGIWNDGNTWLGHQRLSIIDIELGHQPMVSESGLVIVFNGEIYNFIELREQLKKRGYKFDTNCDTEVLLYMFDEYGEKMTSYLRGMFAFVIWDNKEQVLFAARDRLGQKPFYYYYNKSGITFSSELYSLLACDIVPKEISWESIQLYFKYGYIPPPYTSYKNISKLEAGYQLIYKNGNFNKSCYWKNEVLRKRIQKENELIEELDIILRESVKSQLISDVPLGAFLSGGLDSSLIVTYMKECSTGDIKTFSVGFDEPTYNEAYYAKYIAKSLGVENRVEQVQIKSVDILDILIKHFGEPFGDSSAIPTWYLSKYTREYVTVALSGDGGDEIFGGYRRYVGKKLIKYYNLIPKSIRETIVGSILKYSRENLEYTPNSILKMLRYFDFNAKRKEEDALDIAPNILNRTSIENLFLHFTEMKDLFDPIREKAKLLTSLKPEEQMMFLDTETYLEGDINVKVDRMSMANSLEVRSPFLDHNVVEFMASLPLEMKLRGFTTKYLLKKLALGKLPQQIINRKKQGFNAPVGKWFHNELIPIWRNVIQLPEIKDLPFNQNYIDKIWQDHKNKRRDNGYILWHFLIFFLWYNKIFLNNN